MARNIASYRRVVGEESISQLHRLASQLQGRTVVHVNSTRYGGGVAEILEWLISLMNDLGLQAYWEVMEGTPPFFQATKKIHNGLQGFRVDFTASDIQAYDAAAEENASRLRDKLSGADFVFIHDPQPAALLGSCPGRRGKWIWRCHIDASRPYRPVWRGLEPIVSKYDASVFSMPQFARALPHPQFVIAPSIDPLSDKNRSLPESEVEGVIRRFHLDPGRPILTQISRFDRFKDPVGVIQAFRMLRVNPRPQLATSSTFRPTPTAPSTPSSAPPTSSSRSPPGKASGSRSQRACGSRNPSSGGTPGASASRCMIFTPASW